MKLEALTKTYRSQANDSCVTSCVYNKDLAATKSFSKNVTGDAKLEPKQLTTISKSTRNPSKKHQTKHQRIKTRHGSSLVGHLGGHATSCPLWSSCSFIRTLLVPAPARDDTTQTLPAQLSIHPTKKNGLSILGKCAATTTLQLAPQNNDKHVKPCRQTALTQPYLENVFLVPTPKRMKFGHIYKDIKDWSKQPTPSSTEECSDPRAELYTFTHQKKWIFIIHSYLFFGGAPSSLLRGWWKAAPHVCTLF